MKTLPIVFAVPLILCTAGEGIASKTQCVFVALPHARENTHGMKEVMSNSQAETLHLITTYSNVAHGTVVELASRVYCSMQLDYENISDCPCSEVIGVVGDLASSTASIIHTLASRYDLDITLVASIAPSTFLPVTNLALPNVLDMNPLVHYIEALISFTDQLNWTRIGLISDNSHYHHYAAELFQTQLLDKYKIFAAPNIHVNHNPDISRILQQVREYSTKVILLSMDEAYVCLLLEQARTTDMQWPNYAWIIFDYKPDYISTASCSLEGALVLKNLLNNGNTNVSNCNRHDANPLSSLCHYSKVLYDSVMAVVLAGSIDGIEVANMSFTGATGLVRFRNGRRLATIAITQVLNNTDMILSTYDPEFKNLTSISNTLASVVGPLGGRLIVYNKSPTLLLVVVAVVFAFCIAFVSINLFLFVFFRNEKEIKATSFIVSLFMFLGCYLLLLTIPIVLTAGRLTSTPKLLNVICNMIAWLSILGVPPSLILSTLFVKMLRVYALFAEPFSLKKKLYSNYALFLYIILIVSPNVLALIVWLAIDPLTTYEFEITTQSRVLVLESCWRDDSRIFLTVLMLYMIFLILAVIGVGFKTSKIRYKLFQDTKATNAFAFIAISLIVMATLYICYFTWREVTVESIIFTSITLYSAHISFAVLCQVILIVPKIFPPLRRWLSRDHTFTVKRK